MITAIFLIRVFHNYKLITIRKTVQEYLKTKYDLDSIFMYHPFYPYPIISKESRKGAISISRISWYIIPVLPRITRWYIIPVLPRITRWYVLLRADIHRNKTVSSPDLRPWRRQSDDKQFLEQQCYE